MVSVELKGTVLDHIGALMRDSRSDDCDGRVKVGKGVRWSAKRKAYLATRQGPTKRMRTFRPDEGEGDEDIALQEAKDKALAWAAKDEDTPEGDDSGEAEEDGSDDGDGDA